MRRMIWCAACVAGLLLGSVGPLWSGDEAALRGLVEKAIKAHGGADKLAKFQTVTMKGTGKFYGIGDQGLPFTAEWVFDGANRMRFSVELKSMGQTFKMVKVLNGNKGWQKLNDDKAAAMSKDTLAEEKAQQYGSWVATLLPLKDRAFKLVLLGDFKVGDHAVTGVRVSRDGKRDVRLYFDNSSHMLLKMDMRIKDDSGKEVTQEYLYENYKDVDGAKEPMRLVLKRDDKLYVEGNMSEVLPGQKLDPGLFAAP